jgi:hypothetical protein
VDVAAVRLFVMAVAGWWADERQASVAYLIEENRILRARSVAGSASPIGEQHRVIYCGESHNENPSELNTVNQDTKLRSKASTVKMQPRIILADHSASSPAL